MIQPMCYTPLVTHTSHMLRAVSKRTVINSSPCPSEEGQKAMGLICSKGNLVLGVQLFLHQTQRIQFVEVSDNAKIQCSSTENLEGGSNMFWYLRREGEKPTCIKRCLDDQNVSKFACKHETHSSTLEINNVQKTESGIYYCAYRYSSYLIFGNGSTLIVGDSYTKSSWVMLLVPFPHGSQVTGTANLACVIHGVSSPVHVSWSVSGELQEQGLTRSLKAKDGSLTLINHISIPMDTWTSGKNFTCEIKFNSSGNSVKKNTRYPAASSTAHPSGCASQTVRYAVAMFLGVLLVSLSLAWSHCCSNPGNQHTTVRPRCGDVAAALLIVGLISHKIIENSSLSSFCLSPLSIYSFLH
ncbi:unnamed protein product [Eretmochelys imbricata]